MKEKLTVLVLTFCFFLVTNSLAAKNTSQTPLDDGKYKKEWAKVDSQEKKGLPKSALEIVEKIYVMGLG